MYAAIDLGSNSFRMHIGRFDGEVMHIVKSARESNRLAAGLDKEGNLSPAAIQSAVEALSRFRLILDQYTLDATRVVATNTIRVAKNASDFLPELEEAIAHPIDIISGEEEGRLIYMGVAKAVSNPTENRLVVDIGGGSTEIILGHGHEIIKVGSFGVGTVNQSLSFFPEGRLSRDNFDTAVLSSRSMFEDAAPIYHVRDWRHVYGSSGSMRTVAATLNANKIGDGSLTIANLEALIQRCIDIGHMSRLTDLHIKPERTTMVIGGMAILMGVMHELAIEKIHTIEAGLRMGVIWDLHLRATQHDRREQAVQDVSTTFRVDAHRAQWVGDLAYRLYDQLKPSASVYTSHLVWAARLHEVGLVVSQTGYHKHGAYLMEYADMPGFTKHEQRTMSQLVLSQKGNLRKVHTLLQDNDLAKAILALRLAVLFMHTRIELASADVKVRMKQKIELEMKKEWLTTHPTLSYWLKNEQSAWSEVNREFVVRAS